MNLEQAALYLLVFTFGFVTNRLLYYFVAAYHSIRILKIMHVVSLTMFVRSIQEYAYVGFKKLSTLENCGVLANDRIYISAEKAHVEAVEAFKKRSVLSLIELHPEILKPSLEFNDWDSAMEYLENNAEITKLFMT